MLNKINVEQELYKLILKKDFNKKNDIGEVLSVKDGVATIYGLNDVKAGEVIEFIDSKVKGLALNLNVDTIQTVIFGNDRLIKEGDRVRAVSYTHLDVYKRKVLSSTPSRTDFSKSGRSGKQALRPNMLQIFSEPLLNMTGLEKCAGLEQFFPKPHRLRPKE